MKSYALHVDGSQVRVQPAKVPVPQPGPDATDGKIVVGRLEAAAPPAA